MKKRTFIFDGSAGSREALSKVLQYYALAAYPEGGSDCAASSRQALKDIVTTIQSTEICEISTRQRPILKAAVKWFYQESGIVQQTDEMLKEFDRLISMLEKRWMKLETEGKSSNK